MNKKIFLKILLFTMVIMLISFIIFVLYNKKEPIDNLKSEDESSLVKEFNYDTSGDKSMFVIGEYNNYYSSILDKNMIKMGLTVNNDTDKSIDMGIYLINLVDSNKKEIGFCYTKAYKLYYEEDMFSSVVLAGTSKFGYLYCEDNNEDFRYLKITYATKGYVDEDGNYSYDTNDIFVEINN